MGCSWFNTETNKRKTSINIKIHSFTSLTRVGGWGLFNVILVGTGVQLKLRKHPNAYIVIK